MRELKRMHIALWAFGLILMLCAVASAQLVRPRKPNEQVTKRAEPTAPSPGADKGIIIVGGKTKDVIKQPEIPTGPLETRDEAPPKITPNPNPVSFTVSIPRGQTERTVEVSWDPRPERWYSEIFLSINDGEETQFARGDPGTKPLTVKLGNKYAFRMVVFSGENGEDPTTIANLTLTGEAESSSGSPGGVLSSGGVVGRPRTGRDNYIAYIEDAQTAPTASAVAITFWASGGLTPTVEIGTAAPVQASGRWVFPNGQLTIQGTALAPQRSGPLSKKVGVIANTFYKFDLTQPNLGALELGTSYYYIISVQPNPGGAPAQMTGSFTTLWQNLKVVFERIHIIDDSDELSDGDINHWYWVNYGHSSAKGYVRGPEDMESGKTYDVNIVLNIPYAPNTLSLSVSAWDDDNIESAHRFSDIPPPGRPQSTQYFDENVAKGEWDLTRFPTAQGQTHRQVFKLVSMPGGKLQFEVCGYWEVVRLRK